MLTMAFMHCFIVTILTMECFAVAKKNLLSMGWRDKWNILHIFCFFVLSYYESLRSEYRVVMSVTSSP